MGLKNISQAELDEILKQHHVWLKSDGSKGHRADLSYTDLSGINLRGADLHGADLCGADLQGTDLEGTDLEGADLHGADLTNADLWEAKLQRAELQGANLHGADLRGTDLWGTDLWSTGLQGARLNWVNWHEAEYIRVYVAGLQSSRENAQLTYIPSIDVATTGCWQGTWQATIDRIHSVYEVNTRERKAYDLAIEYIKAQMELDDVKI